MFNHDKLIDMQTSLSQSQFLNNKHYLDGIQWCAHLCRSEITIKQQVR